MTAVLISGTRSHFVPSVAVGISDRSPLHLANQNAVQLGLGGPKPNQHSLAVFDKQGAL